MNTTELKAAESALETALDKVRQLIASDPELKPEPNPKPDPVRGPLTAKLDAGAIYWTILSNGNVHKVTWRDYDVDRRCLARGNAFASKRDAEYKAAFDEIWGQPIGEWEPDGRAYIAGVALDEPYHWGCIADNEMSGLRRQWRKDEIGFGDAGKAELERRLAEQKKLDERFGL